MGSTRKIKESSIRKDSSGRYCAVVYTYKCLPTGLYYCGATIHESNRRSIFKNVKYCYGGKKIDSARKQYQDWDNDWEYKSWTITAPSVEELVALMDFSENYLITYYDSLRNGYNSNSGGLGRGSSSRIKVTEKDGTVRIFNSCEDVAVAYTMSPGNVYHYAYRTADHIKRNGYKFEAIDSTSSVPPEFTSNNTLLP